MRPTPMGAGSDNADLRADYSYLPDDLAPWLNRIHHGDALALMRRMPAASVDVVATSPPYNLRNSSGNGMTCGDPGGKWKPQLSSAQGYPTHDDAMPHEEYVSWQRECIREMLRVLKPEGAIFYNHKWRVQDGAWQDRADIVAGFNVRQVIIWARQGGMNHNPGYLTPSYEVIYLITHDRKSWRKREGSGGITDVWQMPQDKGNSHPTPFPVDLPRRAISLCEGHVVLDPFIGSGSTAVAAVLEGWDYIGIEQAEEYCDMARDRLAIAAADGTVPGQSMVPAPQEPERAIFQGSTQLVYDHLRRRAAQEGWGAVKLTQSAIAGSLKLSRPTVERCIREIKEKAAIIVSGRGPGTTYTMPDTLDRPTYAPAPAITAPPASRRPADDGNSGLRDGNFDGNSTRNDGNSGIRDGNSGICDGNSGPEVDPSVRICTQEDGNSPRNDGNSTPPGNVPGIYIESKKENVTQSFTGSGAGQEFPSRSDKFPSSAAVDDANLPQDATLDNGRLSDPAAVWQAVLGRLSMEMPREHFNTFLRPCVGQRWEAGALIVAASSSFAVSWLELPLHQSMANEALAKTIGAPVVPVVYQAIPSVARSVESDGIDDVRVSAVNPTVDRRDPREPDEQYCPEHPEPGLRRRTTWLSFQQEEPKYDDMVYHCKGDAGTCSWCWSRRFGVFIPEGLGRLPANEVLRNYHLKRQAVVSEHRRHRGSW